MEEEKNRRGKEEKGPGSECQTHFRDAYTYDGLLALKGNSAGGEGVWEWGYIVASLTLYKSAFSRALQVISATVLHGTTQIRGNHFQPRMDFLDQAARGELRHKIGRRA